MQIDDVTAKVGERQGVEPLGKLDFLPFPALQKLDATSSLKESTSCIPYIPSKPTLPTPQAVEFTFLSTLNRMYDAGMTILDLNMKVLDYLEEQMKVLNAENVEKMEEAIKLSQENSVWKFLKNIGAYILSALSIVFGSSLSSTGAGSVIGSIMIAVGILGILNLALEDTGCWKWLTTMLAGENEERAKYLATLLPTLLGMGCASLGLIGTSGAIAWSSLNILDKIVSAAQVAMSSAEGVATMGKGVCEYRSALSQKDLETLKEQIFLHQHRFEGVTERLSCQMNRLSRNFTLASEILKLSITSNKRAILSHA